MPERRGGRKAPQPYDPSVRQDNSNRLFLLGQHQGRKADSQAERDIDLFHKPAVLDCKHCGGSAWAVIADEGEQAEGLVMLTCIKCKAHTRPFELRLPQLSDYKLKRMGLTPPTGLGIETDILVERG